MLCHTACLFASNTNDSIVTNTLNEVVVTGSNDATPKNLLPYTVSVVGERQLETAGSTQVLSAISGMVPGLFVTQRGVYGFGVSNGGSGHIKMRGIGGDRASAVLMMVDGQPQFAGIYSHHVADFYGKEYVQRVEVVRGPASVLYGSNAMAGTINVITKQGNTDGIHLTLTSQYGSYNTWLSSLTATARYGAFSALVSGAYDRTDGNIRGLKFNDESVYAKVDYDFSDRWKATADYTLVAFKGKDPVYPKLSNPGSDDVYRQHIIRGETSIALTNSYSTTGGTARVYYSYGNHYVDDPRHFHSLDDRFGVLIYQNFSLLKGNSISVGFDFDSYTGEIPMSGNTAHSPGSLSTLSRKSITEYSPYISAQQGLFGEVLTINGGLRMANSNKFGTRWVPQAGIALNLQHSVVLKASAAMGYRNPSFRELYLYRMANPDLSPERMWNYEATVGKSFSRYFKGDITIFYSKGNNLIQTINQKNTNTGRFINKGVEVSAHSAVLPTLTLNASYSYLHTSLINLTGAPRTMYYLGADWQISRRFTVSADMKGVGSLYVADKIKRQSYAVVNMRGEAQVCRQLQLFVRLENITDARYMINEGYPMPGFTAFGGFRLTL